jgi:hypothetical protein
MMKWLARRFEYTRIQETSKEFLWDAFIAEREALNDEHELNRVLFDTTAEAIEEMALAADAVEQYKAKVHDLNNETLEWGKLTREEIQTILSALVDYHDNMVRLCVGDPVAHRVEPIFEKYDIQVLDRVKGGGFIKETK